MYRSLVHYHTQFGIHTDNMHGIPISFTLNFDTFGGNVNMRTYKAWTLYCTTNRCHISVFS